MIFEKKISIVVLTYFHEDYIRRALDTILEQKVDAPYEILIADDASGDRTVEIAEEYRGKYPQIIRLIQNKKNIGISKNLYNALVLCEGEYIVITAGDDYWIDECKLQKQFTFLENHKEYIAECSVTEGVYTNGEMTGVVSPAKKYWDKEYPKEDFYQGNIFCDAGIMLRNIFKDEKIKYKFAKMYEFSRDIDDLTFDFFLFDCGRIYVSGYKSYAITVRRKDDENQHNYNTKYKGIGNTIAHIDLIRKIDDYYENNICLKEWYRPYFGELLYYGTKCKMYRELKWLNKIPYRYWLGLMIDMIKNTIRR